MKILLVEDDEMLSAVIAKGLRKYSYAVDYAFDGEEALRLYDIYTYDLIILDLNLPKIDGLNVLSRIRQHDFETRVLILSARSEVEDKVRGLDMGANDYLEKPFDFFELDARMRNLLRRSFVQKSTQLTCGPILMDTAKRETFVNQKSVILTNKEYAILEYLLYHQGEIVSAETLIEHVWDSEVDLFSNSLKYHIYAIRSKLVEMVGPNELIQNRRGQGYLITAGEDHVYDE